MLVLHGQTDVPETNAIQRMRTFIQSIFARKIVIMLELFVQLTDKKMFNLLFEFFKHERGTMTDAFFFSPSLSSSAC